MEQIARYIFITICLIAGIIGFVDNFLRSDRSKIYFFVNFSFFILYIIITVLLSLLI